MPATSSLIKNRHSAFILQAKCCFYCGLPMWENNPTEFQKFFKIKKSKVVRLLQCTAEHVTARQDGGKDSKPNIVAACLYCNMTRHRQKNPLSSIKYKEKVAKKMQLAKWHPVHLDLTKVPAYCNTIS